MIFTTEYIPGIPVDNMEYCGFCYATLSKSMFNRDAFRDIKQQVEDLGGNALIGAKMLHTPDGFVLYGTVVNVEY